MRKFVARLVLLTAVFLPWEAVTQAWLPDRSSREGPGILLGEGFVFHPGLGVEGGYDTNPLHDKEDIAGAGRLRITPYLDLATRSAQRRVQDAKVVDATPPKIDLRIGLAGYYDVYFSGNSTVDEQDHFGVDSSLDFSLYPDGPFSLMADVAYIRSLQPYESSEEHWAWHMIYPGVGVRVRPGGGTLSFEVGYRLRLMLFEDSGVASKNNKTTHDVRFITSWKILPKTALVSKINFAPILYLGGENTNNDSLPVRALVGLQGLLTPRFGLSFFAGYGASFYSTGDDFDSFLLQGELMFFATPTANIRVGGQRDFVDSFYSNFFVKTGGYVKYEQMFAGLVLASIKGDVYHRGYSNLSGVLNERGSSTTPEEETGGLAWTVSSPTDQKKRSDVWIGATLLIEVRATEWLAFHASARYAGNVSDYYYDLHVGDPGSGTETDGTQTSSIDPVEFHKFEILAGVRVHY